MRRVVTSPGACSLAEEEPLTAPKGSPMTGGSRLRLRGSTSSTSTASSSCDEDSSLQVEPAGFTLYAGCRKASSSCILQPPPGFGPAPSAAPNAAPSRARRMSEAVVGTAARKASMGLLELGGMAASVSRKASSTLYDLKAFAAAASRKASAHIIEVLELQELPVLRRLQQQSDGFRFQRFSFSGRGQS